MRVKLVTIGNSKGIRIPKALIEQCGLPDELELEVLKDGLKIKPLAAKPRSAWEDAFSRQPPEEALVLPEIENDFDKEWQW